MELRSLATSTVAYGLVNTLVTGVPILLLPLYLSHLEASAFGTLTVFGALVAFGVPIVGFACNAAVQRRYVDVARPQLANYVSSCLCIVGVLASLGLMLCLTVPDKLLIPYGLSPYWVTLAILAASGISVQLVLLAIWQAEDRIVAYVWFQSSYFLTLTALPIFLVAYAGKGWQGAAIAQTLAYVTFGIISLGLLRSDGLIGPRATLKDMRHALGYSVPLVPHLIAGWGVAMADRFIIASSCGMVAVGAYTLAFQVAQALNLLSSSFIQAFAPWLFSSLANRQTDRIHIIRLVVTIYTVLIIAAGCGLYIGLSWLAARLADPRYHEAAVVAPWLIFGFTCNALYRIPSCFLMYWERTAEIAVGTLVVAFASVGLNLLMIPAYGVVAAGWTSAICFGLLLLYAVWRARRAMTVHGKQQ
jgi:O-antigen/teichoic acid export membrane protein